MKPFHFAGIILLVTLAAPAIAAGSYLADLAWSLHAFEKSAQPPAWLLMWIEKAEEPL